MNRSLVFINRSTTHQPYHAACFESLQDLGVDFLLTEGGATCHAARYKALSRCLSWGYDYIGWVDDDDVLELGIYSKLQTMLDDDRDAAVAFARELRFYDTPVSAPKGTGVIHRFQGVGMAHHPLLFRREILERYYPILKTPQGKSPERTLLMAMVADGHYLLGIDEVGYHWRQWDGQDHKQSRDLNVKR